MLNMEVASIIILPVSHRSKKRRKGKRMKGGRKKRGGDRRKKKRRERRKEKRRKRRKKKGERIDLEKMKQRVRMVMRWITMDPKIGKGIKIKTKSTGNVITVQLTTLALRRMRKRSQRNPIGIVAIARNLGG